MSLDEAANYALSSDLTALTRARRMTSNVMSKRVTDYWSTACARDSADA